MSNTVYTPKHTQTLVSTQATATNARSVNIVHAMDAESAGTFEQLVGTILPPASKVIIEIKR